MRGKYVALALLLLAASARTAVGGELFVLAINGGGDRLDNFASHLAHLRQLVDLLAAAGVPRDHVTVLASDGQNPAPDLATREPEPEHSWLLQGTHVDPLLRDLLTFESSVLPGVELRPATQAGLARALAELRRRLHPADTLLLYVTDHGTQSHRDPIDNRITLWGPHESISVRKLGALLANLPSQTRVVSLMSQCYSGGFAYLHEARERSRVPGGATCGYFSSTPDRPAYGCYPEVRGQKAVGHSFEFLSALARRGRFPAAHDEILWSDDTPDIPLRSSDVYLAELLARHAPRDKGGAGVVDPLVAKAFEGGALAAERRLLDRIASLHGVPRPATLVDLDQSVQRLFDFLDEVSGHAKVWETALSDFNRSNLDAFLARHPQWRERLMHQAVSRLDPSARRARATELLAELFPFLAADSGRLAQSNRLLTGLLDADEIAYRTEIRVAALLRIRFVLTSLAGREWIKQRPNGANEAKALEALLRCEDLALPPPPTTGAKTVRPDPVKLPPLAEDQRRALSLRPGFIGITFVPVSRGRRERLHLPEGVASVTSIMPRSPAAEAGLRRGDIVVGAPDRPFLHGSDLRPFIVSAPLGKPLALEVVRGGGRVVLAPVVREPPTAPRKN